MGFYNGYHGYYQCDNNLSFGWYRFRGAAGTEMPTSCVGKNRCSSHATGWLNGAHPSVADGIVHATVCFHWSSGCCHWSINIRVRNCSGFYVYELGPPPGCYFRYCGNGGGEDGDRIGRQADRQTDRQTDRQSDSHTDRQNDRQSDGRTHRQADRSPSQNCKS